MKEKLFVFRCRRLRISVLDVGQGAIKIIVYRKRGSPLLVATSGTEPELISDIRAARQIIGKYSITATRVFGRVMGREFGYHVL